MTTSKQEDSLKNPMRFSIDKNRTIDLGEKLRHADFYEKQVTEVEIRENGSQMYVHWEWADEGDG
jgi:hypothetical protein